jgi:3-oxoacyl-[acyl-carrier protein] reductase
VVDQIKAVGRRALVIRADSGDPAAVVGAVEQTVAEFGRLDILVNNAAALLVGPLEDLRLEEVNRTLDVNVRAPFLAAHAAARHMTEGGRIITIAAT